MLYISQTWQAAWMYSLLFVSSKQLKMILSRNRFLIFSLRMNSNFEVKDIAKNRGQQTWHPVEASWVFTYWSQITHNSKQVDQLTKTHKTSPPSLGTHGFLFYARHDGGMFHNTHLTIVLQISATDSHQTVSVGFW